MTIQKPCRNRSRPCAAICSMASVPVDRSMVIGEASAKPQPKNGIDNSSFFATYASGGKNSVSASVSHVELCLDITICGVEGMFSRPTARYRMPQIQRAPHRFTAHHDAAIRYIGTRGSQKVSSIVAA